VTRYVLCERRSCVLCPNPLLFSLFLLAQYLNRYASAAATILLLLLLLFALFNSSSLSSPTEFGSRQTIIVIVYRDGGASVAWGSRRRCP